MNRLEPISEREADEPPPPEDLIFHLDKLAEADRTGATPLTNEEIDRLVYAAWNSGRPHGGHHFTQSGFNPLLL